MKIAEHIKLPSELIEYRTLALHMPDDIIAMFQSGLFPNFLITYGNICPIVKKYKILEHCLKMHNIKVYLHEDRIEFNNRDHIVHFLNDLISQGIIITEKDMCIQKYV